MRKDPLTEKVIGLAIEVHRHLGPGLLESIYESCLCQELAANRIEHQRQMPISVSYKGADLGPGFRADIVVHDALLVEIARSDNPPPMPPTAIARLKQLGADTAHLE